MGICRFSLLKTPPLKAPGASSSGKAGIPPLRRDGLATAAAKGPEFRRENRFRLPLGHFKGRLEPTICG
jgi:hypothetical protein